MLAPTIYIYSLACHHKASKLLAEKLEFTFDGINKKGFVFPDREMYCDELIYSLEK